MLCFCLRGAIFRFRLSARLASSAALLPTSQAGGDRLQPLFLEKLTLISQRLQEHLRDQRWPKLQHLKIGGICYPLPLSSKKVDTSALAQAIPPVDMAYLAGFFDGDGCVSAQTDCSGCVLIVSQQIRGLEILLVFLRAFGGSIYLQSNGKGSSRPTLQWRVCGDTARCAARVLCQHCIVKKQQLDIVWKWPIVVSDRIRCSTRLAQLKRFSLSLSEDSKISWSYVTGFFDAEGCIRVSPTSNSTSLDISQKDPAILLAIKSFLQSQMKSLSLVQVLDSNGCHQLRVSSSTAVIQMLQKLLANGLIVKKAIAFSVLASILSGASHLQLREVGFSSKGNQRRYARLDADGCDRAKQIKALQTRMRRIVAARGASSTSEGMQSELATMQLEHKIISTQIQIRQLRADIASIKRMIFEDSCSEPANHFQENHW